MFNAFGKDACVSELFWAYFFGHPYHSNGTKIYLDVALHTTDLSSTLRGPYLPSMWTSSMSSSWQMHNTKESWLLFMKFLKFLKVPIIFIFVKQLTFLGTTFSSRFQWKSFLIFLLFLFYLVSYTICLYYFLQSLVAI